MLLITPVDMKRSKVTDEMIQLLNHLAIRWNNPAMSRHNWNKEEAVPDVEQESSSQQWEDEGGSVKD